MKSLVLAALVACSSSSSSTPPPGPPNPPARPIDAAPASNGPGVGETCGANDACAAGLTCVSYYGIAGPRGPQFKSCEITCANGGACPDQLKCITIADGPGQVCRGN